MGWIYQVKVLFRKAISLIDFSEYDTWEPEANMPKNKVKEFKKRQNSSDDEDDLASDDPDKEYTVEVIVNLIYAERSLLIFRK